VTDAPVQRPSSIEPAAATEPAEASGHAAAYDVVIVGAGPAGLSAALNLARARRSVLLLDGNRPRNAATLVSHGFMTRDGIPPHELRRLAREELARYPEVEFQLATVTAIERANPGFVIEARGVNASPNRAVTAAVVLIASGLRETLPALPSIRSFYGMGLFSCIQCDGYEHSDKPLALIGETSDLASRALLIAQWSHNLVVFTNGVAKIGDAQEALLASRGVRVERRVIADVIGERGVVSGVLLVDGETIAVDGGFVRPRWDAALGYAGSLGLDTDGWGLLETDAEGRTSEAGVYAAGDSTAPGPQQLIVAAGAGARTAAAINRDLIGIPRH
jgi:thioredoxin reductase